jgi:hypothetical protein
MYYDRTINEKHTAAKNLSRGVPSHMRGEIHSEVKRLIKMGFIIPKITNYGLQVCLNHNMIAEIEKAIGPQ